MRQYVKSFKQLNESFFKGDESFFGEEDGDENEHDTKDTLDRVKSYLEIELGDLNEKEIPSKSVIVYTDDNDRPIFHYFTYDEEKGEGHYYINEEVWNDIENMGVDDDDMIGIMISVWLEREFQLEKLTPVKHTYHRKRLGDRF